MSDDYVSRIFIEVNGAELDCSSCEESGETQSEPVPTMNRDNVAKGFKVGVPVHSITVEAPLPQAGVPVDVTQLHPKSGDPFRVVVEKEGGARRSYSKCSIKKWGNKGQVNNTATISLEIAALSSDDE